SKAGEPGGNKQASDDDEAQKKRSRRGRRGRGRSRKRPEDQETGKSPEQDTAPKQKASLWNRLKKTVFGEDTAPSDEVRKPRGGKPADSDRAKPDRQDNRREGGRSGNARDGNRDDRNRRDGNNSRNRSRSGRNPGRSRQQSQVSVEDIPDLFKEESDVLVQAKKGPIGTKGARVTTNLSIAGRYLVLMPNSPHRGVSKRVEDRDEKRRLREIIRDLEMPKGMGVICRTVGAGRKPEVFQRDLDILLAAWHQAEETAKQRSPICVYQEPDLAERCIRDYLTEDVDEIVTDSPDVFATAERMVKAMSRGEQVRILPYRKAKPLFLQYGVSQQIEAIYGRKVNLPSGGYLVVDETEALIAIDVNTGKHRSAKGHPETILITNLEAAKEVARQLRLRNVGGLIVIDFIDMRSREDRQAVSKELKTALQEDRARTKVSQISIFGLVEMTRQRAEESVRDSMFKACPYCRGKGLVKSPVTLSVEIQRRLQEMLQRRRTETELVVTVHPTVLERLTNEDRMVIKELKEEFNDKLSFVADVNTRVDEFQVVDKVTGDAIR
ncbi:MAG: Rne/Rng family ribonuclease, partial [Lentisphaeria bacterium]|nr:Rne/Rng family ribonuclease [Lentisphaeria bacterium]